MCKEFKIVETSSAWTLYDDGVRVCHMFDILCRHQGKCDDCPDMDDYDDYCEEYGRLSILDDEGYREDADRIRELSGFVPPDDFDGSWTDEMIFMEQVHLFDDLMDELVS